jgi:hypothetical protein
MQPTIGRTVIYKTTAEDRLRLEKYSHGAYNNLSTELPAIIVAVWGSTTINAQVIVDGNIGTMWKTSISEGDAEGQWSWPIIQK